MLIEAAKGGHTNVVQLLLDYPELCNSNADNNLNLTASSSAASIVTNTAATATQTSVVNPASVIPEVSKPNTAISKFILKSNFIIFYRIVTS